MLRPRHLRLLTTALLLVPTVLFAWDYEGHRIVNQLALASLPDEYPKFTHAVANAERVAFLAGEPDRWRNVSDLPLRHFNGLNHYCDMEYIPEAGLDWDTVPSFRYDFVVQFAAGRAANARNFLPFDPAKNTDHTREWPGFAPWAITENFGKLRSAFSYLKSFESLGTHDEILNAQANILYVMGVLGHYVGDCAQPLHTTKHHNGWVGDNPKGYTTWPGLHRWIDGGIIGKEGIRAPQLVSRVKRAELIPLAPRPDGRDPLFVAAVAYLKKQHAVVETLYQLEKAGKLGQTDGSAVHPDAKALIENQLLEGGHMLGSMWLTAFRSAGVDTYLNTALAKRQAADVSTTPGTEAAKKANP